MTAVPPLITVDQLPVLAVVPDDALIAVWTANRLWAAPRSAVGTGGGPGVGGYATIQQGGVPLTQRDTLNVTGGLLQASDSGGKTVLNLAAIALASQVSGVLPIAYGGTGLSALGTASQSLRVNAGGTAFEFYTPGAGLNAPAGGDNAKVAVASGGNLSYAFLTAANLSASAGVALTQLAPMNAARLLGRDVGSGAPVELTIGGGIETTGSGGVQRSALTGDVVASAGSNATKVASTLGPRGAENVTVDLFPSVSQQGTVNDGGTATADAALSVGRDYILTCKVLVVDGSAGILFAKTLNVWCHQVGGVAAKAAPDSIGFDNLGAGFTLTAAGSGANMRFTLANSSGTNRAYTLHIGAVATDKP